MARRFAPDRVPLYRRHSRSWPARRLESRLKRSREWAAALGLPHAILAWRGDKPTRALQEEARAARYALLFAHAKAVGAEAVATAHHADDQWETLLFRLARGSGIAGLAGMARDQHLPAAKLSGGRLIRPLLGLPKRR